MPWLVVHRTTAAKDHLYHSRLLILTAFGIVSGSATTAVHTEVGVQVQVSAGVSPNCLKWDCSCQKISDMYGTNGPKRRWERVRGQPNKKGAWSVRSQLYFSLLGGRITHEYC